jgi:hypothetical protein
VATCSEENKREERKFQAQALACLIFIELSFVFALCDRLLDIIEVN